MFKFKKFVIATITATLLSVPIHAAPTGQYVRCGYIEDVDREGDFTVLVTKDGNVWFWESASYQAKTGRKIIPVGGKIVAVIDGNGTKTSEDDILVDFEIYR